MGEIKLPVTQGHKHGMRVLGVQRHIVVNIQLRQDRYTSIPVQGGYTDHLFKYSTTIYWCIPLIYQST